LVLELGVLITALLLNTTSEVIPLLITIEENTRANAVMTKRLLARQQAVKKLPDDSEWPMPDIG
jgi:hypothetical protein